MASKRKKKKKEKKERSQGVVEKPAQEEPKVAQPDSEPQPEACIVPPKEAAEEMAKGLECGLEKKAAKPKKKKKKKKQEPTKAAKSVPPPPPERKTTPARPAELDPLRKLITADDTGKEILKGRAGKLRVVMSGDQPEIILGKKKPIAHKLSSVALKQLNEKFKIPEDFMPTLPPGLRADIYNWFFSTLPKDQKWRIFTKGHFIRGLIFDDRKITSNVDALKAIMEGCLLENYILDAHCLYDHYMQFRVVLPEMSIAFLDDKKERGLFAGLQFTSSELGLHTLKADFCIWRETSTINIIPRIKGKRYFRIIKPPNAPQKEGGLKEDLKPVYANLEAAVKEVNERIELVRKIPLKPLAFEVWIEKMRSKYRFARLITERAVKRFESEEQNHWGAVCAFAYIAGKARDDLKRYELECMAGLFLENV